MEASVEAGEVASPRPEAKCSFFKSCLLRMVTSFTFGLSLFSGMSLTTSGLFKDKLPHDDHGYESSEYKSEWIGLAGLVIVCYSLLGTCLCCSRRLYSKYKLICPMNLAISLCTLIYSSLNETDTETKTLDMTADDIPPPRVDERVLIGALPWISIKDELIEKENVRGVVSMNENFELAWLKRWVASGDQWTKSNVSFLQLQTQDIFESPSQDKLRVGVDFILSKSGSGESVYVHCKAGRTRSATLVCCYLMKKNLWTPEQAYELLALKRPQLALHKPQWTALRQYHEENIKNNC